jgi:hypothetical protein
MYSYFINSFYYKLYKLNENDILWENQMNMFQTALITLFMVANACASSDPQATSKESAPLQDCKTQLKKITECWEENDQKGAGEEKKSCKFLISCFEEVFRNGWVKRFQLSSEGARVIQEVKDKEEKEAEAQKEKVGKIKEKGQLSCRKDCTEDTCGSDRGIYNRCFHQCTGLIDSRFAKSCLKAGANKFPLPSKPRPPATPNPKLASPSKQ